MLWRNAAVLSRHARSRRGEVESLRSFRHVPDSHGTFAHDAVWLSCVITARIPSASAGWGIRFRGMSGRLSSRSPRQHHGRHAFASAFDRNRTYGGSCFDTRRTRINFSAQCCPDDRGGCSAAGRRCRRAHTGDGATYGTAIRRVSTSGAGKESFTRVRCQRQFSDRLPSDRGGLSRCLTFSLSVFVAVPRRRLAASRTEPSGTSS